MFKIGDHVKCIKSNLTVSDRGVALGEEGVIVADDIRLSSNEAYNQHQVLWGTEPERKYWMMKSEIELINSKRIVNPIGKRNV